MSNIFIVFKEPVIAHNEIKLLHSFKIRQLQGAASIRIVVAQDHDNTSSSATPVQNCHAFSPAKM